MADGLVFAAINDKGEIKELSHQFFDMTMDWVEFAEGEGLEYMNGQLPKDLKDVHILITFKYDCHGSYDAWEGDYDFHETYTVLDHVVLQTDFKEFQRNQLSLGYIPEEERNSTSVSTLFLSAEDVESYIQEIQEDVNEWEEFYDTDFVPVPKEDKPKAVNEDFLTLLKGEEE